METGEYCTAKAFKRANSLTVVNINLGQAQNEYQGRETGIILEGKTSLK